MTLHCGFVHSWCTWCFSTYVHNLTMQQKDYPCLTLHSYPAKWNASTINQCTMLRLYRKHPVVWALAGCATCAHWCCKHLRVSGPVSGFLCTLLQAVWEEGPASESGAGEKSEKSRHFGQLVTPENPVYMYDVASSKRDSMAEVPDIHGIALSSSGCTLHVLNRNSNVVAVYNGLSHEGLRSLVAADKSEKPVVHLHWPLSQPQPRKITPTRSVLEKEFIAMKRHFEANNATVSCYQSEDPLHGFIEKVKRVLQWPDDKEITVLPAWDATTNWPAVRPIYYTTLAQLGLVSNTGMHCLADYLLPERSRKLKVVRAVIRGLLMNPPPYDVAAATRRVVRHLGSAELPNPEEGFPQFDVSGKVTPDKVELVLGAAKGNHVFFRNLQGALKPAIEVLTTSHLLLSSLAVDIWPLVCHTMKCPQGSLDRDSVLQAAQDAVTAIHQVVADADSRNDEKDGFTTSSDRKSAKQAFAELMSSIEDYQKRVKPESIKEQASKVDEAYYGLLSVLDGLVHTLTVGAQQAGVVLSPKDLPAFYVDGKNQSIWVTLPLAQLRAFWGATPFKILKSIHQMMETSHKTGQMKSPLLHRRCTALVTKTEVWYRRARFSAVHCWTRS
eukprot:GHUV01013697.1.p1 GENE.GHUV01013697.1~~GHUV01013697.1.p1  ORF type:complete len:612 (+),score=141.00 GHUV01013697.1:1352-3187(+)